MLPVNVNSLHLITLNLKIYLLFYYQRVAKKVRAAAHVFGPEAHRISLCKFAYISMLINLKDSKISPTLQIFIGVKQGHLRRFEIDITREIALLYFKYYILYAFTSTLQAAGQDGVSQSGCNAK
jgi:hypothetical protein